MNEIGDEWLDASRRYYDAFGEGFPSEMYGGSQASMVALMRECIDRGEPYDPPLVDEHGTALVY